MKALLIAIAMTTAATTATAQSQPQYRMEIGAGAGLAAYVGDLNGSIVKGMQPFGAAVLRYKLNPRMAWSMQLGYGQLKGEETIYAAHPEGETGQVDTWSEHIRFKTPLVDWHVRYEYNFWPFGTGKEYYGARPLTPFIALGFGLAFTKTGSQAVGAQLPIGLGVKAKIADRVNLTAEWLMHFTGTDKIDGTPDPYGIKSTGLFKNTDGYGLLQLSLTYDFWEKCKTCHNDND